MDFNSMRNDPARRGCAAPPAADGGAAMSISRDEDLSVLRKAFDTARAVHVGIDIQHYYCDPRFGNPHDTSWYGMIDETVKKIDAFTDATRAQLSSAPKRGSRGRRYMAVMRSRRMWWLVSR
jgi:broad specificity phosphatase PhoE